MKFKLLLLTLVFSTATCMAKASDHSTCGNPGTGADHKKTDIAGGVVQAESKKPLGHVSVTAYSASKKERVVMTDMTGNYSFSELKPGTYKLVFEKNGFKKVTRDKVMLKPDEGCQLNVEMDAAAEFQIMPGQIFSDFN